MLSSPNVIFSFPLLDLVSLAMGYLLYSPFSSLDFLPPFFDFNTLAIGVSPLA